MESIEAVVSGPGAPPVVLSDDDATSFDARYPELARVAFRAAYRLLGSIEDADDVSQEACARAYARWSRLRSHDAHYWVARVATNLAIDRWRRLDHAGRVTRGEIETVEGATAERIDLHRALDTLPKRQRQIVLLRYVADLPEAAVARALHCSVGNVKAQSSRGLAALRALLQEED